ncbi:MAG TPA: pyridoxamine 5'-phosphate oxidase family protein [Ilumatobacter sp.]
MPNPLDPTILELDEHQCWDLLRSQEVGRLAVAIANHPDIFPVNFVVDHASVVFRTAEGTKLAAAVLGESVAFEADGESEGEAWSVVVKGRAVEIEQMYELFDALDLPLYPWHAAPKHRFVRILPELVTGRRFRVADRVATHANEPPHHRASPE